MPTKEERERLRELRAAATQGRWYVVGPPWRPSYYNKEWEQYEDVGTFVVAGAEDPQVGTAVLNSIEIMEWDAEQPGPDYSQSDADLECAAEAVNALVPLLDTIDALEAERDALCAQLDTARAEIGEALEFAGVDHADWFGTVKGALEIVRDAIQGKLPTCDDWGDVLDDTLIAAVYDLRADLEQARALLERARDLAVEVDDQDFIADVEPFRERQL